MQHYFGTIAAGKAILEGGEAHHLINVRRSQPGEQIEVSDNNEVYLCLIKSIEPLEIEVLSKVEEKREPDIDLTIAFGVLKGDHNDLIVLKGTELGVAKFVPFTCERTVVVPKEEEDNRILRLRRIAVEGAAQCRRAALPTVTGYKTLHDVLAMNAEVKIFAYEELAGGGDSLFNVAREIGKRKSVLVVIGPEGGFTHEEARLALDYDFRFVSLGRRILRAETAALYSAALLCAASEAD